jgi:hypothetical protein
MDARVGLTATFFFVRYDRSNEFHEAKRKLTSNCDIERSCSAHTHTHTHTSQKFFLFLALSAKLWTTASERHKAAKNIATTVMQ